MGPEAGPGTMADFSNQLTDPLDAARRRHGFASADDLAALDRIAELGSRMGGAVSLRLEDRGGAWYQTASGVMEGAAAVRPLALEGTDVGGTVQVSGPGAEGLADSLASLVQDLLKARRLGAERRRNPRGPEGASFVPGLTHELRNFLFSMGAGLDAFEARFGAEEGPQAEHGRALRRNLDRLQAFLEELGEYGNPGQLTFSLQPLAPVLAQAGVLAAPLAQVRQVGLSVLPLPAPASERMDRSALEGALRRLLELAILETREGGTVTLAPAWVEGPGRPWIEALVTGAPGRGRDLDAARLFEPFYYRDKDMPRLGPATARRVIEAHGGQAVALEAPEGPMLRVMLPVWKPEEAP